MIVSRENLEGVVEKLTTGTYALDTETSGLRAHHGDRLFSLILSTSGPALDAQTYYFNFQAYAELAEGWVLPRKQTLAMLGRVFANSSNTYFLQNAKFDLAMLAREGVELAGRIYDTEVMGRLLYNRHMKYSLDSLVKEIGMEKSGEVEEYIAKHKLFTWVESPGKEKKSKWPHYDKVPFAIMSRYGEQDGSITLALGHHQRRELTKWAEIIPGRKLESLIQTEADLVKTCFAMEETGIRIDKGYCETAYAYETAQMHTHAKEFKELSGVPLLDSRLVLAKAFTAAGEKYPLTEKGNPSFTDEVLEGFTTPLAQVLRNYRTAVKRGNTYFANFLYYADAGDRIHPNMRQAGTDTGRMSYSNPNLQNVPKEDEGEFPIRRSFVPDSPDHLLVAIDYNQMEYRMLLEYAKEAGVIRKILDEGMDVHQATADTMGVDRKAAKTLNFLLLYGGGAQKLADEIGTTLGQAQELKEKYFDRLPGVRKFSQGVARRANTRGYIFNWAGRVCHFPLMMNPRTGKLDRFAYRGPNHLIQGGCADVVKIAMNQCHEYLRDKRTKMLLQVHDEILFSVPRSEMEIVPALRKIMESAYPARHLPLTCSVAYSPRSWADTVSLPNDINELPEKMPSLTY